MGRLNTGLSDTMGEMLKNIALAFIQLFVAVDAIGVLPIFASLTEGISERRKSRILAQSMLTATLLAVGFIFMGRGVFKVLGITIGDFMIAGGAILFCLAIIDVVSPVKRRQVPDDELGAVPIGTPLIVGPAVLTASLLVISQYGLVAAVVSVVANILLAGLLFRFSSLLTGLLGESGSKAVSKIMSLLLAAIAVMLMRKGIVKIVTGQ